MTIVAAKEEGSSDGGAYYTVEVQNQASQKLWNSATEIIITVAVHNRDGQGQCLAYCPFACCLDPSLHPHSR